MILSITEPRARKAHRCDICFKGIEPGTVYHRQVDVDGRPRTWRAHIACHRLWLSDLLEAEESEGDLQLPEDIADWSRAELDAALGDLSPWHPERERARRLWQEARGDEPIQQTVRVWWSSPPYIVPGTAMVRVEAA